MSEAEILGRISDDIYDLAPHNKKSIVVGMTVDLFRKLFPEECLLHKNDSMATLFGCKVKVFPCTGMWWIVGYEGTAM